MRVMLWRKLDLGLNDRVRRIRKSTMAAEWSGKEVSFNPMIKPHILVVETDFVLLNILARALRDRGYQTSMATEAKEAQVMINRDRLDMAVMECLPPDRSRVDLSACADRRGLPIILMSDEPKKTARTSLPHHRIIKKPFQVIELLRIIEEILGTTPVETGK
jgi:DNA-binding response OmpR family regulator